MPKVTKTPSDGEKMEEKFKEMSDVGAHVGYSRSRRHPSICNFLLTKKGKLDVFDLAKIDEALSRASEFAESLGVSRKVLLFVGNKPEAREMVKEAAFSAGAPYVVTRWVGGLLTNFSIMRKRVLRLKEIKDMQAGGTIDVYTKKERTLIDKEKRDLETIFGGVEDMEKLPDALFVIDSREEGIAVAEARKLGIPVISLSNSDCDISKIEYPIVGNDAAVKSISYFVNAVADAYSRGKRNAPAATEKPASTAKEGQENERNEAAVRVASAEAL